MVELSVDANLQLQVTATVGDIREVGDYDITKINTSMLESLENNLPIDSKITDEDKNVWISSLECEYIPVRPNSIQIEEVD